MRKQTCDLCWLWWHFQVWVHVTFQCFQSLTHSDTDCSLGVGCLCNAKMTSYKTTYCIGQCGDLEHKIIIKI